MRAQRAVLGVVTLLCEAVFRVRERLLRHPSPLVRLQAELFAAREEIVRLRAERDILRGRLGRMAPARRPHYPAWLRLQILIHRRAYGLSLLESARLFLVSAPTISRWEEDAAKPKPKLTKTSEPLNRLSDIVAWLVHRLKELQLQWGTRRIAQVLARAGVKCSRSSAQRFLRRPRPKPKPPSAARVPRGPLRAKRPGHLWLLDHMTVDFLGLRRLYVTAIVDLYSRLPVGVGVFADAPTARDVTGLLARAVRDHGKPRHVVTDRGNPFRSRRLVRYLARQGIRRRYGAVSRPQSVAVIDRFFKSVQTECLRPWMAALPRASLQARLQRYAAWHSRHRPHQGLRGRTPWEVWSGREHRRSVDADRIVGIHRRDFGGDHSLPVYRLVEAA